MKNLFISALMLFTLCLCTGRAQADTTKEAATPTPAPVKDVGAIIKETEKIDSGSDSVSILLWIPIEYWKASLAGNPRLTTSQMDDMLSVMDDYTVVLVVDAKKGGLAIFTYTSAEEIAKNSTLTLPSGQKLSPLSDDDLTPAARNLFTMFKPLFANMMGKMGENANFLVFSNKDKDGKKLLDSLGTGKLVMNENGHVATWRLPLGSLMAEKVCPLCGETLPGNYLFCPYDGTKLK